MNHLTLIGHLAGAPSHTASPSDSLPRAFLTVAVPRRGTTATDWIGVAVVGPQAVAAGRLADGALVAIDGYLHTTCPAGGAPQTEVVATYLHQLAAPNPAPRTVPPPSKENAP